VPSTDISAELMKDMLWEEETPEVYLRGAPYYCRQSFGLLIRIFWFCSKSMGSDHRLPASNRRDLKKRHQISAMVTVEPGFVSGQNPYLYFG
jgi:hypothetical protein